MFPVLSKPLPNMEPNDGADFGQKFLVYKELFSTCLRVHML